MNFWNQSWFWTGAFTLSAALVGTLIRELIASRSQIILERLKLYDSEMFKAYNNLYRFLRLAESYWEPGIDRRGYIDLMKSDSFKVVQENLLFYRPEIQKDLQKMEIQYKALGNPDVYALEKSFVEFIDEDYLTLLNGLETSVKQITNQILLQELIFKEEWQGRTPNRFHMEEI